MRVPLLPTILMIVFTILIAWYVFSDISRIVSRRVRKVTALSYGFLAIAEIVIVVIFLIWPKRNPAESITVPMWLLFTYLTLIIPQFVYCLFSIVGRIFKCGRNGRRNYAVISGIAVAAVIFIFMWWGVSFTRREIEVNRLEVSSKRLPQSLDGLKVVQFSDIHVGTWGNDTTFISELVDSINAQKGDIVVFTGDFVNRISDELLPFVPVLKRIKATYGVFAIFGNHDYGGYVDWPNQEDYYRNLSVLDEAANSMGWKLLKNYTAMVGHAGDSIAVIGVENWGEPPFNQLGDLVRAYPGANAGSKNLNDSVFKLLLTHNPNHWSEVATKISNVDLTLSGHTHAMQFVLGGGKRKWSPSVWKYKNWGGLYHGESRAGEPMNLYVNVGAGEEGFPARIGESRPEINLITLRSEK